jgi:hypothetical protein
VSAHEINQSTGKGFSLSAFRDYPAGYRNSGFYERWGKKKEKQKK